MKKISSKKLQLRSSTIAILAGPAFRIVQGGTNDDAGDTGGDISGTTEGAGIKSGVDGHTRPTPCNSPITTAGTFGTINVP